MVGKIKIGKLHIRVVLRHRFEKKLKENYLTWNAFRDWRLGFWFKKTKAVGRKNFQNPAAWSDNLAISYIFGIDALIIKMWIDIDCGVMHF